MEYPNKEALGEKIKKVQIAIVKNREQYDKRKAELEELHNKQKAIAESPKSYVS